jgi:Skp family chaperone for outer membrane proteins
MTSVSAKLQKEIDAVQAELHEFQEAHRQLLTEADLGREDNTVDATAHELEADMEELLQHLEEMKKLQRRANAARAKPVPRTPVESGTKKSSRPAARGMCASSPRK